MASSHASKKADAASSMEVGEAEVALLSDQPSGAAAAAPPPTAAKGSRVLSLDITRGFTMFWMIMVDNQGNYDHVTWLFNETEWDGLTTADCVFPTFLFLVGVSIAFALQSKKLDRALAWQIVFRAIKMFFLGAALNLWAANFAISKFFIMGVLQRIAICYVTVAFLFKLCPVWAQRVSAVLFMGLYLALMYGVNVPDCGRGNLSTSCNAGQYLDRFIWGQHMPAHSTLPEGIVSSLDSIVTTLCGLEFGRQLRLFKDEDLKKVLQRWLVLSFGMLALGLLIFIGIPVNKKIWTPSFTFVVASISGFLSVFWMYVVDYRPPQPGTRMAKALSYLTEPLRWHGRNAIIVFVAMVGLEILLLDTIHVGDMSLWYWIYWNMFANWLGDLAFASSVVGLLHFGLWTAVVWAMDRRKLYITL